MFKKVSVSKSLLTLSVFVMLSSSVLAKDDRLRCRDDGPGGREADLRFEDDEFRAKWEIDLNEGQVEGDVVSVTIDGVFVGGISLFEDGDELEGDIRFEDNNFPDDFPEIKEGTPVEIGALFCRFERD